MNRKIGIQNTAQRDKKKRTLKIKRNGDKKQSRSSDICLIIISVRNNSVHRDGNS